MSRAARTQPNRSDTHAGPVVVTLDRPLIAVTLIALLCHLPHLPLFAWPLLAAGIGWRLLHEWRKWPLPPALLVILLGFISGFLVLFTYHSLWGRDAGVTLLTLAAMLKLLESRQQRDQYVLLLLGFFLIVALLLYDQGVLFALIALSLFWGLVVAWIGISNPGMTAIKPRLKPAGVLMIAGLPVTFALFVLFPRPPGAPWGAQQPTIQQARTGLSDTLNPGSFEQLASDPAPAFRVSFAGPMIPPAERYWRVLVMSSEDDGIWQADGPGFGPTSAKLSADWTAQSAVTYTITLEPAEHRWLPALALAIERPSRSIISPTATLFALHALVDRYRYTVTSNIDYRLDPNHLDPATRARDLELPQDDPRLKALGRSWRHLSPLDARDKALDYFRAQGFRYTLTPGKLPEHNRMDDFLFTTKRGYCEHYASAFTLLMRAAGVPARIVTGYQGGEVVGDYLLVRQADAHAWSEIWVKNRGWVRVDPTAVVAPERIASGVANAARDDAALPATLRREAGLDRQFALIGDRLQNGWNQYVLGYGGDTQSDLLARLGLAAQGLGGRFLVAAIVAGVVWLIVLMFWRLLSRPNLAHLGAAQRAWYPVERALTRLGIPRTPEETLQTYCQRASRALPSQSALIDQLHKLFSAWLFSANFSQRSQKLAEVTARHAIRQLTLLYFLRRLRGWFGAGRLR
ncbi:hypothetical protein A9404_02520 [Halothiobacillus diazotrophicus]|uniref:Transglutaminase-like domain-containing protein n=1 Tax=Halothiobacillus diazotrophicus TaxID=1860122 RepID=A0A191ZEV5_9GAMM|nr:DUF3488 and transglutaminase-like domain-containing protein [Halothiobacillus diazotrophicus]ANJ66403.1 hypothetical protein A9404_02520 [Halothiobacillus diazotrophicus]